MKVFHATIYSLLFALFCPLLGTAQAYITPALQQRLDGDETRFRVRLEFVDNVDAQTMKIDFEQQAVKMQDRPRMLTRALMQQANASQEPVLDYLSHRTNKFEELQRFWIVNIIVLKADEELIYNLSALPEIALIDIEENKIEFEKPVDAGTPSEAKAVGGIENGLAAINAPAMWALGYTGRARKAFVYDTGVWPQHPSIRNRFLGNGYAYDQTWNGYFSPIPTGANNDHGTHVCGTIMGLDTATADTIGVAFKSYWMASDHITSTVGGLPDLTAMIAAFEWGMNPDGDTVTTYDIPDVINNSWRWRDDPDTVHCGGFIVNLMNAIEAAGIANVFSGGNSGPNNTTVNSPQRINTTEVNTFSVGSVNGNNPQWPISTFSTLGPTQCPGSGSLSIHPEVVAPGQNVRSAWGMDSYNSISGTSMAAPHVSGAILLLKEAFPNVAGDELLEALYYSAIDLGTTGEDNTYGNGMIDVYAAYLYLSQTHTPMPPSYPDDLAVVDIILNQNDPVCDVAIDPKVVVANVGDNPILAFTLDAYIDDVFQNTLAWTGNLQPGGFDTISLGALVGANYFGPNELLVHGYMAISERDSFNNRYIKRFQLMEQVTLPMAESFDQGIPDGWYVENTDGAKTWGTTATSGLQFSVASAWINHYDYYPRESQKDGLFTPYISTSGSNQVDLHFNYAWQKRSTSPQLLDTFRIFVSTDICGSELSWTQVYENYDETLSTHDTITQNFFPLFAHHWGEDSVDLSAYSTAGQMTLKFEMTNRAGNNFFLDNVNIFADGLPPASVAEFQEPQLQLFPNPSNGMVHLKFEESATQNIEITVFDMLGHLVEQQQILAKRGTAQFDLSAKSAGIYVVKYSNGSYTRQMRVVKH